MRILTLKHQQPGGPVWPCTIVTGATSGIGFELATQLADASVRVIALGRNPERLQALAARHPNIETMAVDLNDLDALPLLVAHIVSQYPDVACLINNAGIQYDMRVDDASYSSHQIRHEVDVNLVAPLILAQSLLPHLQSKKAAWIVNVTSGLAYVPKRTSAVYSATKAGLHLFTRALRVQLRGRSVQVVEAVMPLVDTPMTQGRDGDKLSAAQAAREVLDGLRAGRQDIRVGKTRAMPLLQWLAPGLLARLIERA